MTRKVPRKLFFVNIRLFLMEVLIIFVTIVFLMAKQAEFYGADLVKESDHYIGWYLLYWGIAVFAAVSVITFTRYFFIDRPIKQLSMATMQVASGDFSIRLKPYPLSSKSGYINVMYQDFNKMVEELSSIEILKNDFVSNLSHEIKTPLAVIQSYTTLLRNPGLSPLQNIEYANTICNATEQLTSLVTNVLRLSKLESQSILPAAKPYDVCRQLSDCVMAFADQLEEKQIEFSADMEDSALVIADESIMEIVWNNLLSNAIKFTERGGKIILTQRSDQDSVTVSVEDDGCGMDGATIKHIFEKFYQGDTVHAQEGYGLGLALSARIVALSDGDIRVASEPGNGSVFTVQLKKQT